MMHLPGRWTYSWPGLAGLWCAGRWRGLGVALAFSVLLNAALVVTFVPSLQTDRLTAAGLWAIAGIFWGVSAWNSHSWLRRLRQLPKKEELDRLFVLAQEQYLRGHWVEAEQALRRVLTVNPDDPEARLLLASVLRRSGRSAEARAELSVLAASTAGGKWSFEVIRERQRLDEAAEPVPEVMGLLASDESDDSDEEVATASGALERISERDDRRKAA